MVTPLKYVLIKVMETIKKKTSKYLSKKFTLLKKVYRDKKRHLGQKIFCIFCKNKLRINEEKIQGYVKLQEKEETGQNSLSFELTMPVKAWKSI